MTKTSESLTEAPLEVQAQNSRQWFRIGEVAEALAVKPSVLRFWETEFKLVRPRKTDAGQRLYSRVDLENLSVIFHLLYREEFSIAGARKQINLLRSQGALAAFRSNTLKLQIRQLLDSTRQDAEDMSLALQNADDPMADVVKRIDLLLEHSLLK